jgi:hypothetical protein
MSKGYEITKTNQSTIDNIDSIENPEERMRAYQYLYTILWMKIEKLLADERAKDDKSTT